MNSAFFAESCFEIAWLFRNCLINFNFSKKWVSRLPKITFLLMPCPSVKHLKLKKKTNLTFFLDFLSLKLSLWSDSKLWNGCDIHYLDLSPVSRLHARECNHVISRVVKHVLIAACSVLLLSGAFPSRGFAGSGPRISFSIHCLWPLTEQGKGKTRYCVLTET